jgi:hypothetical protein
MKKTIAIIALSGLLFISCKKGDTVAAKLPNQDGVNISKSANIDMVTKLVDQASTFDFVNFKANFAPNAILHDNGKSLTLDENVKMLEELKAKGMVFNPGKEPLIWEIVNDKADPKTGITNYVITYYHATFTRNGKSVPIIYNMNFAVKDGKVQEEWDTYDSAPIMELLK